MTIVILAQAPTEMAAIIPKIVEKFNRNNKEISNFPTTVREMQAMTDMRISATSAAAEAVLETTSVADKYNTIVMPTIVHATQTYSSTLIPTKSSSKSISTAIATAAATTTATMTTLMADINLYQQQLEQSIFTELVKKPNIIKSPTSITTTTTTITRNTFTTTKAIARKTDIENDVTLSSSINSDSRLLSISTALPTATTTTTTTAQATSTRLAKTIRIPTEVSAGITAPTATFATAFTVTVAFAVASIMAAIALQLLAVSVSFEKSLLFVLLPLLLLLILLLWLLQASSKLTVASYRRTKKICCKHFLMLIGCVYFLHSSLLWNAAEAAISNRATNVRTLSNAATPTGPQPRFLSRGHTYRAVVGDTLVLPCQVENLGNFVLLWRRGINVLTASNIMVTRDDRIRLIDGYNLEISDLEPQDAGDYVCQISDKINRDQVHTVEILVPPSVRATPTSGQLQARKGGPVTLECKGSGNPVPSIYWTKKTGTGKSSARIGDGPILTLDKVERQQAGIYQCTADNGVGDPVSVDIRLDVLYPPDIQVEKSWIHSGEGFEAKLVCIVYADPVATVSWYQNSFLIQTTDRRIMSSRANRHTLTIRHIQQEDFGNYSCVADNSLGRSRKYMELSGRPGPAEFYSPKWGRSSDSYNLTWKIDSYPPLEEVRLLYRRVLMNDTFQQPGRWHDFILTPEHRPPSEPLTHIMSYTIKNLVPGAYYEAIVQAKNRYGWNEVSDIFQFIVASNSIDIPPEESEVVASSKSRSNSSQSQHNHTITSSTSFCMASILVTVTVTLNYLCQVRRQFGLGG